VGGVEAVEWGIIADVMIADVGSDLRFFDVGFFDFFELILNGMICGKL
jgi:hypothetical protein